MTNMPQIVPENKNVLNHILFLDLDGPMFPDRWISFHSGQRKPFPLNGMPKDVTYWVMDPLAVEMLNFLHDLFPFQTVISSSWRKFINKQQMEDLFSANNLNLKIADDWATTEFKIRGWDRTAGFCARAAEINEFVERHEITEFMCLDDPWSGSSLDDKTRNNFDSERIIMVNPDLGIGTSEFRQMKKIVCRWGCISENPLWNS